MRSGEYWKERMELLQENLMQRADALVPELEQTYQRAADHIQKEIESFYQRYAKEEKISFVEAKQNLTALEKKRLTVSLQQYIRVAQDAEADPKWIKALKKASVQRRVTRLEALKLQICQQIEVLAGHKSSGLTKTLGEIFEEGYYRTTYEIQKGLGVGAEFAPLDVRKINKVLAKPWSPDGESFSQRVWKDRAKLLHEMDTTLTEGIITGDSPQRIIAKMQKALGSSRNVTGRLVLSEGAAFSAIARQESYDQLKVEEFQYLATLDGSPCSRCAARDLETFPVKEYVIGVTAPPLHPFCRCTTVPFFKDGFTVGGQRAARNEKSKVYYVPEEMSYEEWKKAFVNGEKEILSRLETVKSGKSYKKQPSKKDDFTIKEEGAIMQYISSKAFTLNDCLRNDIVLSADDQELVEHLDNALKKMPFFEGIVQRTVDIATDEGIEEFVAQYQIGGKIQYKEYLSTTKGDIYNSEARIQIYIQDGSKGRDISSFNNAEKEILYERNSEFVVLNMVEKDGTYHILLKEVKEDG